MARNPASSVFTYSGVPNLYCLLETIETFTKKTYLILGPVAKSYRLIRFAPVLHIKVRCLHIDVFHQYSSPDGDTQQSTNSSLLGVTNPNKSGSSFSPSLSSTYVRITRTSAFFFSRSLEGQSRILSCRSSAVQTSSNDG